jgi:DNA-binding XRE family transcriptional regulator
MDQSTERAGKALRLVERLLKLSDDEGLRLRALQIRRRLQLPMSEILAKVKGDTVAEKIKLIGVSRQAYYKWVNGQSRPSGKIAKRLSELTGYSLEDIRSLRMRSDEAREELETYR